MKVHYPKQAMYTVMLLIIIRIEALSVCKKNTAYIWIIIYMNNCTIIE